MAQVGEKGKIQSDVVAYEFGREWGFCREQVAFTGTATVEMGSVLYDNAGTWTEVDAADCDVTLATESFLFPVA